MLARIKRRRGISTVELVVIAAVIGIGVIVAVSAMTPSVNTELNSAADFVGNPAAFGNSTPPPDGESNYGS